MPPPEQKRALVFRPTKEAVLPALNGATGSLGNFPQCLTGTAILALADDAALARLVIATAYEATREAAMAAFAKRWRRE